VFAVNGRSVTIGVLSDGVDSLARAQASGDLPRDVTVLAGQNGVGDEGTAMLEIVHDLAPSARLLFATGFNSIESFADNIRALRAAGADIIVDDIGYFVESPFQLGQASNVLAQYNGGAVSQAVNDVARSGALYFSSAGNSGNLNDGTSGVWEGNFANGGATTSPLPTGGTVHDFNPGSTVTPYNVFAEDTNVLTLFLHWSDPLGASGNDYDLYVLDSTGTQVIAKSNNVQNGTQDPVEGFTGQAQFNLRGIRFVIVKKSSASTRYLHLNTNRGRLQIGTDGQIYGHPAVPTAVGMAATPAGPAPAPATVQGPFPNPFSSVNVVERFSSDGPRQFFYTETGAPITPGNVVKGGGSVVPKPDLTAADGVSTQADPQEAFNPFFGTSAAAPHAAAIAALVKQANPALSSPQVLDAMRRTAIDIEAPGFDRDSGVGILDAYRAVSGVR
jgi:subtilisin family serine protease